MYSISELRRDFLVDDSLPARVMRLGDEPSRRMGEAALAIGAFDGFHRGHRHLLELALRDARSRGAACAAVTFDPDPDEVVSSSPAPKLLSRDDRLRLLSRSGADAVLVVPFTRELAALDHAAFFENVLGPVLDIRSIHVGSDFRLGAHGAATVEVMRRWGEEHGVVVFGHELVLDRRLVISATQIRSNLAEGRLEDAKRRLGRRYMVRGTVVRGRGEGTAMGFPTANVRRDERLQMPADGVYAGWTLLQSGVAYPAAINVGLPPMFADDPSSASLEATLLGFSGDLYGQGVSVLFSERLRPPRRFDSIDELIEAVRGNMEDVRQRFGEACVKLF